MKLDGCSSGGIHPWDEMMMREEGEWRVAGKEYLGKHLIRTRKDFSTPWEYCGIVSSFEYFGKEPVWRIKEDPNAPDEFDVTYLKNDLFGHMRSLFLPNAELSQLNNIFGELK